MLSSAASSSVDIVRVAWMGPGRGFGVLTTRDVQAGEVLFRERPSASWQANSALVAACANERCLRLLGGVEQMVARSHAFYAAVMAQQQAQQQQQQQAAAEEGDDEQQQQQQQASEKRAERCGLMQQLLPQLPAPAVQRACRGDSAGTSCGRTYCSSACEAASWQQGHSLLCSARHPPLAGFFADRNVARNADAQVAAQIIAAFVADVAMTGSTHAAASATASPATLTDDAVRALWTKHTSYHAAPWSSVLALQAVSAQVLDGEAVPLAVVAAHLDALRKRDELQAREATAAESGKEVAVCTIGATAIAGESATATAAPAPAPLSSAEQSILTALDSTQVQYRGALQSGFSLLRSALLSTPDVGAQATLPLWRPFVSLAAWDLLAGANRLNCTLTQTAVPFPPDQEEKDVTDGAASPLAIRVSEAPAGTRIVAAPPADAAAASASSASSSPPPMSVLASALESLFAPLALPLAGARALLPLHSKMNHACGGPGAAAAGPRDASGSSRVANARVENATEHRDIAWSVASERRAAARAQAEHEARQARAAAAIAAKAAPNCSNGNRKKKAQKARKEAAAAAATLARQMEQLWRSDEEILRAQLQQRQVRDAQTSGTDSPVAAAALPPSSSQHTCEVVVRATRSLKCGDEVLINYLPQHVARANTHTRRQHLQTHYLFTCDCGLCKQK